MEMATYCGISVKDFWELTPREIIICKKSFVKRREDEYETQRQLITMQAYLTSRFVWQKRIDIKKFLNIEEEKKEMSDKDMLENIKALTLQFGGKVVYKKKDDWVLAHTVNTFFNANKEERRNK